MGPCVLGRELPAFTRSALERAKDKKRRVSRVLCGEPLQVPKDALRAKAGGPAKTRSHFRAELAGSAPASS